MKANESNLKESAPRSPSMPSPSAKSPRAGANIGTATAATEIKVIDNTFLVYPEGPMKLKIFSIKAKDLVDKGNMLDAQDPAVRIKVGDAVHKTERKKDSGRKAEFPEEFTFDVDSSSLLEKDLHIEVEAINESIIHSEKALGKGSVSMKSVLSSCDVEVLIWVELSIGGKQQGKVSMIGILIRGGGQVPAMLPMKAYDAQGGGDGRRTYSMVGKHNSEATLEMLENQHNVHSKKRLALINEFVAQKIAGKIPLDLLTKWNSGKRSYERQRELTMPYRVKGVAVSSDSAGLSKLSGSRPLLEVLWYIHQPKEIVFARGHAVGGMPVGIWAADNTFMFYPDDKCPAADVVCAMVQAQSENTATSKVQIGLGCHLSDYIRFGDILFGDQAELVEELAEEFTKGGKRFHEKSEWIS